MKLLHSVVKCFFHRLHIVIKCGMVLILYFVISSHVLLKDQFFICEMRFTLQLLGKVNVRFKSLVIQGRKSNTVQPVLSTIRKFGIL